jgi:hypothetical protein
MKVLRRHRHKWGPKDGSTRMISKREKGGEKRRKRNLWAVIVIEFSNGQWVSMLKQRSLGYAKSVQIKALLHQYNVIRKLCYPFKEC